MAEKEIIKNLDNIRLPHFDWDKTKYFYYVAKLGSISAAGDSLNITQSSVSKKINLLEHHLKSKLFIRHSRGIKLTRDGEKLFTIIEKTFLELREFIYHSSISKNTKEKSKRFIRIATTHAVATYILNAYLILYTKLHPEISFEIITNDRFIDLVINDVDIVISPLDQKTKHISQTPLFSLEKKMFASTGYLKKNGTPKTIEDLHTHSFLSYPRIGKYPYSDIFWSLKLGMPEDEMRQPKFTSSSLECLVEAAQQGLGILGTYEKMSIVRNSGLNIVLPHITSIPTQWYFTNLQTFDNDECIQGIKRFLCDKLY